MKRTRSGSFEVSIPSEERLLLRSLPSQVLALIEGADPSARRIFPPAYEQDPELESEYRELMHDDLMKSHREALAALESTAYAEQISEDQAVAWLAALNNMRLVLGTRLEVAAEPDDLPDDDPRAPAMQIYAYLGVLEDDLVDALSDSL